MNNKTLVPFKYIINSPVTSLSFDEQTFLILKWARHRESKIVCLANVHMVMEAYWDTQFRTILTEADLVAPDGMPLVWMLKLMRIYNQNRVAGMDLFLRLCELSQFSKTSVFFLGSEFDVLEKIKTNLTQDFPELKIAGIEPLPFRSLSLEEDQELIEKINQSGAQILFVCLGCPKQEKWMLQHRHKIKAVMIGLGAVFSIYAGVHKRAPKLMRNLGLEWFYRLMQEPRRLWSRYLKTIPPFLFLASLQILNELKDSDASFLPLNVQILLDVDKSKIGEILVNQQIITEEELKDCLEYQKSINYSVKIGQIFLERELVSLPELMYYLENQQMEIENYLANKQVLSSNKIKKIKLQYQNIFNILFRSKPLFQDEINELLEEFFLRKKGLWLISANDDTITKII